MTLTPAEVYALTLLAAMMLGAFLGAIGIFEEIAYGSRWLLAKVVPLSAVRTSAQRTPQRLESAAAAGGSAGPERSWSSPSGPAAVPLDYVPPGWTRDARGLHPPAPRHASSERINCGGRMTERTVPRKRTADHAPWETDHFAVVRPEPYEPPVFGEVPVARVLGIANLGPADAKGRTLGERVIG